MENLPHEAGKSFGLTDELMEGLGKRGRGEMGYEKFCTNLYLPGRPGLGIMDMGDVWNGPIREVRSWAANGPM